MSSLGICVTVDDIGLEPTTPTMSSYPENPCVFSDFLVRIYANKLNEFSQSLSILPGYFRINFGKRIPNRYFRHPTKTNFGATFGYFQAATMEPCSLRKRPALRIP